MLEMIAPLAVEYVPASQAVQKALAVSPVPVKYVPAGHRRQVPAMVAPAVPE